MHASDLGLSSRPTISNLVGFDAVVTSRHGHGITWVKQMLLACFGARAVVVCTVHEPVVFCVSAGLDRFSHARGSACFGTYQADETTHAASFERQDHRPRRQPSLLPQARVLVGGLTMKGCTFNDSRQHQLRRALQPLVHSSETVRTCTRKAI